MFIFFQKSLFKWQSAGIIRKPFEKIYNSIFLGLPTKGVSGGICSHFFLKSYFARDFILEICFCVILQDIQNFFGSGTSRMSSVDLVF